MRHNIIILYIICRAGKILIASKVKVCVYMSDIFMCTACNYFCVCVCIYIYIYK